MTAADDRKVRSPSAENGKIYKSDRKGYMTQRQALKMERMDLKLKGEIRYITL